MSFLKGLISTTSINHFPKNFEETKYSMQFSHSEYKVIQNLWIGL